MPLCFHVRPLYLDLYGRYHRQARVASGGVPLSATHRRRAPLRHLLLLLGLGVGLLATTTGVAAAAGAPSGPAGSRPAGAQNGSSAVPALAVAGSSPSQRAGSSSTPSASSTKSAAVPPNGLAVSGTAASTSGTAASTSAPSSTPVPGTSVAHLSGLPGTGMPADTVPTYDEVARDGGVFTFGGAPYYGSMGGKVLNRPIVGMAPTPDGRGYWLVASDGGIFAFGDAGFYGSTGAMALQAPIVGMAPTPDGRGYWLVAADGGIFAFGDAPYYGSMGGKVLNRPIVGMAPAPDGRGYWLVAADGGIFAFGDAGFYGSTGAMALQAPIVGMAPALGDGQVTLSSVTRYAPGATGYDVSVFQENASCTSPLPSTHTIGIVQVTGASSGYPNPCLAQEADWAGTGLNLYTALTGGTSNESFAGCGGDASCDWGAQAAQYAVDYAEGQGVGIHVTWWLDVEGAGTLWGSDLQANAEVVAGAIHEMQALGLTVGIYASPLTFSSVVGSYQPDVPLWVAWYTGKPQANCADASSFAQANGDTLPTGGVWITQYTDNKGVLDGDYAC